MEVGVREGAATFLPSRTHADVKRLASAETMSRARPNRTSRRVSSRSCVDRAGSAPRKTAPLGSCHTGSARVVAQTLDLHLLLPRGLCA